MSDSATPWTAAYHAPPSMGFSRPEYWSGVPLPSLAYGYTNSDSTGVFSERITLRGLKEIVLAEQSEIWGLEMGPSLELHSWRDSASTTAVTHSRRKQGGNMTMSVSSCPPDFSQGLPLLKPNWKAGGQVPRVMQSSRV